MTTTTKKVNIYNEVVKSYTISAANTQVSLGVDDCVEALKPAMLIFNYWGNMYADMCVTIVDGSGNYLTGANSNISFWDKRETSGGGFDVEKFTGYFGEYNSYKVYNDVDNLCVLRFPLIPLDFSKNFNTSGVVDLYLQATSSSFTYPLTITFYKAEKIYTITDQKLKGQGIKLAGTNVGRVTGVDYKGLGGNFYAPESPITAESYATLISNASQVTDKAITISTESAKLISEYCQYNPTTATANTLIADANAKGFEVKTFVPVVNTIATQTVSCENATLSKDETDGHNIYTISGAYRLIVGAMVYGDSTKKLKANTTYIVSLKLKSSKVTTISIYNNYQSGSSDYLVSYTLNEGVNNIEYQFKTGATIRNYTILFSGNDTYTLETLSVKYNIPYTLLPSLSFDGSHYVNSGLSAKSDSNAIIDYYTTGKGIQILFGIAKESGKLFDYVCAYNNSARVDYNSTSTATLVNNCTGRHIIDYGNENAKVDGSTIIQTGNISPTDIIPIGACLDSSSSFALPLTGYVYSATINGQLFIPSNNGTTNGLLNLSTLEFKPLTAV